MNTTIAERVQNGCTLLDETNPRWREGITPATLRVDSCYNCVLGQMYKGVNEGSGYENGLVDLWPDYSGDERVELAAEHGFAPDHKYILDWTNAQSDEDRDAVVTLERHEFAALTAEWRRVLSKESPNANP